MIASPEERTLSFGAYLGGVIELVLLVAPVAYAAWRIRATALPSWRGPAVRLGEASLGLAMVVWLAEAVGTLAGLEVGVMTAASIAIGVGAWLVGRRVVARGGDVHAGGPPGGPSN